MHSLYCGTTNLLQGLLCLLFLFTSFYNGYSFSQTYVSSVYIIFVKICFRKLYKIKSNIKIHKVCLIIEQSIQCVK